MPEATAGTLARDVRVIGLVSAAHFTSHFFQLALPPLFPLLHGAFDVPYVALGLLVSLFYVASGVGQTMAGFLVDRFGARPVLLAGMTLLAGSVALVGASTTYPALVALALAAGLGNSVFHPADYSLINAAVTPGRLGRAYSVHAIAGTLGYAIGPAAVVALSAAAGWRAALGLSGLLGLVVTILVATRRDTLARHRPATPPAGGDRSLARDVRVLLTAPIVSAFAYFTLYATAVIGFQTFSVAALVKIYEVPIAAVAGALTGFLLGLAAGILAGGFLADRTARHDLVTAGGLGLAATLLLALVALTPPLPVATAATVAAGVAVGLTLPARDLIVRAATPVAASGKVFGFVYSGFDVGSSLTPLLFGWFLDRGEPRLVFVTSALLLLLTIAMMVQVRRFGARAAAARAAAVP